MAAILDLSYTRFLAVSIAVHVAMFLALNRPQPGRLSAPERIPVSIVEIPEKREPTTPRQPANPTRSAPSPAVIAKKPARPVAPKAVPAPMGPASENQTVARARPPLEPPQPAAPSPPPAPRPVVPEETIVAERPLPTMKDLLPPLTWSADAHGQAPVSLNTRDPLYVSYFTKIKQLIESQWEYPELALRYGLQGRLSLVFTIGPNGQLQQLRLLRSSGSQLLDDEALRAIKAAAPFPPIPDWIKASPLSISAAMEYHDNRVHYQFAR
jgi:protein TonB